MAFQCLWRSSCCSWPPSGTVWAAVALQRHRVTGTAPRSGSCRGRSSPRKGVLSGVYEPFVRPPPCLLSEPHLLFYWWLPFPGEFSHTTIVNCKRLKLELKTVASMMGRRLWLPCTAWAPSIRRRPLPRWAGPWQRSRHTHASGKCSSSAACSDAADRCMCALLA